MIYDKNVYILGAGFSRDAGAPLMSDFLMYIRDLWSNPKSGLKENEKRSFGNLLYYKSKLTSVRSKISIDLTNVEELLGLAEMDIDWGKIDAGLKTDYVYTIIRTLELATSNYSLAKNFDLRNAGFTAITPLRGKITEKNTTMTSIYHLFASMIHQSNVTANYHNDAIITFNYDLLLDRALLESGLRIDYNNFPLGSNECKDSDYLNISKYYSSDAPYVHYLKLHGSANWVQCEKCGKVMILPPHQNDMAVMATVEGINYDSYIKIVGQLRCKGCGGQNALRFLIVPPTWNKFQYQKSIGEVWRQALNEIREAHRIIVIGYSLPATDTFFKYLLTLGCHTEDEPEIIVINPDEEGTKPRYEAFVDQYYRISNFKFYKQKFDKTIFNIKPTTEFIGPSIQKIVYRKLPS